MAPAHRRTIDLSQYPDLVVIYLGMRVHSFAGLKTLVGFGPKISDAVAAKPDGLLLHEQIIYSLFPLHLGMRQYWRDFQSLETWSRSESHRLWWQSSSATPEGPVFGTKPISFAVASKLFTTTYPLH